MRLIKVLSLAALAVAALLGGVFVAAIIAAATVVAWLVRRFLFKVTAATATPRAQPSRGREAREADVIDVTATEVPTAPRDV